MNNAERPFFSWVIPSRNDMYMGDSNYRLYIDESWGLVEHALEEHLQEDESRREE